MINYFRIGVITKPHGIKGEFNVYVTCDNIDRFFDLKKIYILHNNIDIEKIDDLSKCEYNIQYVKKNKNLIIIKLKNYDDINLIEQFRNCDIYIDRQYAQELKDNEYYIPDLIDMDVLDEDNNFISKVLSVEKNLVNFNLLISYNNKQLLIPFIKDYIKLVDTNKKIILLKNTKGLFFDDI